MNLVFRTRRARAFLGATTCTILGPDAGTLSYRLDGRARMFKQDFDGPGLDFELPPHGTEERHMRDTPLPATVRFETVASWEQRLEQWRNDWTPEDAVALRALQACLIERAKAHHVALIWYVDADQDLARQYGRSADASLELYLRVPEGQMEALNRWLERVATYRTLHPKLTLDGIHFTDEEEVTRRTGQPTWGGFLNGRFPALAKGYWLDFLPVRKRRR